jgi:hypothetical protein
MHELDETIMKVHMQADEIHWVLITVMTKTQNSIAIRHSLKNHL